MTTPASDAFFQTWLDKEIAEAETDVTVLRDEPRTGGYYDGYLDALKSVRAFFVGDDS